MADDIASLGYDIDSSQARTAAGDLDKMSAAATKAATTADKLKISNNGISTAYKSAAISAKQLSQTNVLLQKHFAQTGQSAQVMGKQVRAASQHSTNLMFQFQDIAMMLAAGQNPLMLAMQQGTQVSGVFQQMKNSGVSAFAGIKSGLLAMVNPMALVTIGSIAGVAALTQWAAAAWGAGDEAKEFSEVMDDLSTSINEYKRYSSDASKSTFDLSGRFGYLSAEASNLNKALATIGRIEAIRATDNAIEQLTERFGGLSRTQLAYSGGVMRQIERTFYELRDELSLTDVQAATVIKSLEGLANASTMDEKVDAANALNEAFIRVFGSVESVPDALLDIQREALILAVNVAEIEGAFDDTSDWVKDIEEGLRNSTGHVQTQVNATNEYVRNMAELFEKASSLREELGDAAYEALTLSGVDIESGVDAAAKAAARLAADLGLSLAAALSMQAMASQEDIAMSQTVVTGPAHERFDRDTLLGMGYTEAYLESIGKGAPKARTGGGGRGDTRARELEAFIASLQTERETLEMWRIEQLELLSQYSNAELEAIGGQNEAKLRLEAEYQERLKGIRSGYHGDSLDQAQTFFGEMAGALSSGNEKLVKIGQAFASVESLINAYRAYNQVIADPSLPWFAKIPAAAGVLAAGLKTVQSIKGISGGGGGSGGSAAPSSASGTTATQAQPERVVRVAFDGPEWVQGIIEPLMTQIYEQTGDGTKVVFAK